MVSDLVTYLPGDLLVKVDLASMAHSLECRGPFLDHRVVELAMAMPTNHKIRFRQGRSKVVLKQAFSDLLPAAIKTRPKMGFGVPISRWFRNELKNELKEVLLDPVCLNRGIFRPAAIERLVAEHMRRRARTFVSTLGTPDAGAVVSSIYGSCAIGVVLEAEQPRYWDMGRCKRGDQRREIRPDLDRLHARVRCMLSAVHRLRHTTCACYIGAAQDSRPAVQETPSRRTSMPRTSSRTVFRLFITWVAATGVVSATRARGDDLAPRADERQLSHAMHSAMSELPTVTVGRAGADIIGADNRVLQAAVDYVAGLGGGVVEIGEGEYLMRDSLHLRSGVTVRGRKGKTILRKADAAVSPLALDGDFGEQQVTVKDPAGFAVGAGVAIWDDHAGGFHTTVARITGRRGNTFAIDAPLMADCMVAADAKAATVFPVVSGSDIRDARVEDLVIEGNKGANPPSTAAAVRGFTSIAASGRRSGAASCGATTGTGSAFSSPTTCRCSTARARATPSWASIRAAGHNVPWCGVAPRSAMARMDCSCAGASATEYSRTTASRATGGSASRSVTKIRITCCAATG